MKKDKSSSFDVEDLPWDLLEAHKLGLVDLFDSADDIPHKQELAFLANSADLWFAGLFSPKTQEHRNTDSTPFWQEFKKVIGNPRFKTLISKLESDMEKAQGTKQQIHNLPRQFGNSRSMREVLRLVASIRRKDSSSDKRAAKMLPPMLKKISKKWAKNPPATMNADSMEYLLCGFLFGRFFESATVSKINQCNSARRNRMEDRALQKVNQRIEQIQRKQPQITPSPLQEKLCNSHFDGFTVRTLNVESEKDQHAQYRKQVAVQFENGAYFPLPRLDGLLTKARKKNSPKRRFGKS